MPKVTFLNEAVTVNAPGGKTILELAQEADINLFRGFWNSYNCGGRGLCPGTGCRVWVSEREPNAAGVKHLRERLHFGLRGTMRLACQARVGGECEVRSQPNAFIQVGANMTWEPDAAPARWKDRLVVREEKRKKAAGKAKPGAAAAAAAAPANDEAEAEADPEE